MDYLIGILVFALMMGLILSPLMFYVMFYVMITIDTNKMEKDKLKREEGKK